MDDESSSSDSDVISHSYLIVECFDDDDRVFIIEVCTTSFARQLSTLEGDDFLQCTGHSDTLKNFVSVVQSPHQTRYNVFKVHFSCIRRCFLVGDLPLLLLCLGNGTPVWCNGLVSPSSRLIL